MTASRKTTSQIALPLGSTGQGAPQRIVVGAANEAAIVALRDPANWPFGTAILTGPARSGKTLLGRWAMLQRTEVELEVIDGADGLDETKLFHRWNAGQDGGSKAGQKLLLIADSLPWEIDLPDLRSRLGGSLQLQIYEPDDALAAELILAMAAERGLALSEDAANYLVPRTQRSYVALERLVETMDRISLERQTPATMSVWRAALEAVQGPEQQRLF